jgi:hypothetical protein
MEKRIDLTQFAGITEGSWFERTGGNMARWIVRGQFLENDANEALICAAPDLLAELKKMYAKEDALIAEAKDLIYYDKEDEMWRYDESKSGNPGLDAMDFVAEISTMNE